MCVCVNFFAKQKYNINCQTKYGRQNQKNICDGQKQFDISSKCEIRVAVSTGYKITSV